MYGKLLRHGGVMAPFIAPIFRIFVFSMIF